MIWAKEHGAVGIFFRGMEGNLTLDNPYFFSIYAQAEQLDLPICIHTGSGSRYLMQLFDIERNHTFAHNRVLPVFAFRDLVHNRIPEKFPSLRFGFIEAAASWVPYIWHVLRRQQSNWKFNDPQELFSEYRFWVACEADEELPHLVRFLGEDKLIIGSDYGHNDPSKEPQFVANLRSREDVPRRFNREDLVPESPSLLWLSMRSKPHKWRAPTMYPLLRWVRPAEHQTAERTVTLRIYLMIGKKFCYLKAHRMTGTWSVRLAIN